MTDTQQHIDKLLKQAILELLNMSIDITENSTQLCISAHRVRLEVLNKKLNAYLTEYQQEITK